MQFDVFLIGSREPVLIDHPASTLEDLWEQLLYQRGVFGNVVAGDPCGSELTARVLLPQNRIQLIVEAVDL